MEEVRHSHGPGMAAVACCLVLKHNYNGGKEMVEWWKRSKYYANLNCCLLSWMQQPPVDEPAEENHLIRPVGWRGCMPGRVTVPISDLQPTGRRGGS